MSDKSIKYKFVAVEGNIGAGKTSLCKSLCEDLNAQLILESFVDNPFLPKFYNNPERFAFSVELFFMTERHRQLKEQLLKQNLFNDITIADYFFLKTLLFAKQNLREDEYLLFKRIFDILNTSFPKPDLLIYLHRPMDALIHNINKRGRVYEKDITIRYLKTIQSAYFDYFKTEFDFPILIVDVADRDFLKDKEFYLELKRLLQAEYRTGMNYINIQ